MKNVRDARPARSLAQRLAIWACLLLSPHLPAQELKLRVTFKGQASVICVAISPDGNNVASGGDDNTVRIWNVASGKEQTTLKTIGRVVWSVAFSPNGKTLASGTIGDNITLWDVGTGKGTTLLNKVVPKNVQSTSHFMRPMVVFSPDGKTLASGGTCIYEIRLWDLATAKQTATLEAYNAFGLAVTALAITADSKILASVDYDGVIKRWDPATNKTKVTLKTGEKILLATFTSDGKTLAASGYDDVDVDKRIVVKGWVKLWDVANGKRQPALKRHTDEVCSMTFSPDGKTLAMGSQDGTIKVWDVATDKELATIRGHNARVACLGYSADGEILVSGSWDKTIKVWTVAKTK